MRGGFGETLGRPGRCAFLSLGRGGRPAFLGGADFQGGISRCVRWRLPGGPARPTWHFPCAGPGIYGLGATSTSALGGLVARVWSWEVGFCIAGGPAWVRDFPFGQLLWIAVGRARVRDFPFDQAVPCSQGAPKRRGCNERGLSLHRTPLHLWSDF